MVHKCFHCGLVCDCNGYDDCDGCTRCKDRNFLYPDVEFDDDTDLDDSDDDFAEHQYDDLAWADYDPDDSDEEASW